MQIKNPKISIGLPVYNGEKFIRRSLDSLLSQTFSDFELIISDNASTDATAQICEEYTKKDKRVRYIQQKKNMGMIWNFNFVLEQSKSEYFIWTAMDDILLPTFLEKNLDVLITKKKLVCSVSKIGQQGINDFKSNKIDFAFKEFIKKLRTRFRFRDTYSLTGSYEDKVRFYLTRSTCQIIYGVFKTDVLKKCIIHKPFVGIDWAIILGVLKYGDIHVIDEILMHEYEVGESASKGIIKMAQHYNIDHIDVLFPWYPLTRWSAKILGKKIFIKNLDFFFRLNLEGFISQVIDLTRILALKFSRK